MHLRTGWRMEKIVIWGKDYKTQGRKLNKAIITRVIIQARSNQSLTETGNVLKPLRKVEMRGFWMTNKVTRWDSPAQHGCGRSHQAKNIITASAALATKCGAILSPERCHQAKTVKRGRNLGGRGIFFSFTRQAEWVGMSAYRVLGPSDSWAFIHLMPTTTK